MSVTLEEAAQLQTQSIAEDLADLEARRRASIRKCERCGCTDDNVCIRGKGEPCFWLTEQLCSYCGTPKELVAFCEQTALLIDSLSCQAGLALELLEERRIVVP